MTATTGKETDADEDSMHDEGEDRSAADELETPEDGDALDVDTTTDGDEPAVLESDSGDNTGTQRRWPRRVLMGAAVVVFVALLVAVGFLGWKLWQQRQVTQAGEQAQQAAVSYAQVLTSIDSNKVDENFQQVLEGATGEFKDMYSQSSEQLRQLLIDNEAKAHGVVVESAVQSASTDKAVVLLFVDQSVSNTHVPDPRIDRSRIKMTMEDVDGRWRASKVEIR